MIQSMPLEMKRISQKLHSPPAARRTLACPEVMNLSSICATSVPPAQKKKKKKSAGYSNCECIYLCGCVGSQPASKTGEMNITLLKGTLKKNQGFSKGILKCLFISQRSRWQLAVSKETCFEFTDILMHVAIF